MEVAMSEAVKKPLWQSMFFLCLWCISPPQFSQQRHTQKHRAMMGVRTKKYAWVSYTAAGTNPKSNGSTGGGDRCLRESVRASAAAVPSLSSSGRSPLVDPQQSSRTSHLVHNMAQKKSSFSTKIKVYGTVQRGMERGE
ncbi:hypothetical protein EYF80_000234 [Liparis tanakae]|uniref:Uncharacterized protein n=1 Tax=Liparis tanakae TaxID=230148 RepID=A0A4Z2JI76_9TELE|nr:hypothetical protein EYF80_000234 [Liparis tanakae]